MNKLSKEVTWFNVDGKPHRGRQFAVIPDWFWCDDCGQWVSKEKAGGLLEAVA